MKLSKQLFLIIPLALSFEVHAASDMKPGLWENRLTVKSQSGRVEKLMEDFKKKIANMPPEQREMMESAMASQGLGISPKDNIVKVCISKEQAANLDIPQGQNRYCDHEVLNRTTNSVKVKFNCKGSRPTTGEGEFTLTSPTAYTGQSIINTTVDGKPDRMDLSQKGKWLSSNCGKIRAYEPKK